MKCRWKRGCAIAVVGMISPLSVLDAGAQSSSVRTDRGYENAFRKTARDRAQATETRQGADAEHPTDGVALAPGVRGFAGVALVYGHDSNLDLDATRPRDSNFGLIDLGVGLLISRGPSETVIIGRGSHAQYDLDFRSERWDAGALIDNHYKFGENWALTSGSFFCCRQHRYQPQQPHRQLFSTLTY